MADKKRQKASDSVASRLRSATSAIASEASTSITEAIIHPPPSSPEITVDEVNETLRHHSTAIEKSTSSTGEADTTILQSVSDVLRDAGSTGNPSPVISESTNLAQPVSMLQVLESLADAPAEELMPANIFVQSNMTDLTSAPRLKPEEGGSKILGTVSQCRLQLTETSAGVVEPEDFQEPVRQVFQSVAERVIADQISKFQEQCRQQFTAQAATAPTEVADTSGESDNLLVISHLRDEMHQLQCDNVDLRRGRQQMDHDMTLLRRQRDEAIAERDAIYSQLLDVKTAVDTMQRERASIDDQVQSAARQAQARIHALEAEVDSLRRQVRQAPSAAGAPTGHGGHDRHLKDIAIGIQDAIRTMTEQQHVLVDALRHAPAARRYSTSATKVKQPSFNGEGDDLNIFFDMFCRFCRVNDIPAEQQVDCMLSCLHKDVYRAVYDAGLTEQSDSQAIVNYLRSSYGGAAKDQNWVREFMTMQRREGESLIALSKRMQTAVKKSKMVIPLTMLMERFILAIGKTSWSRSFNDISAFVSVDSFEKFVAIATKMERNSKRRAVPLTVAAVTDFDDDDDDDEDEPQVAAVAPTPFGSAKQASPKQAKKVDSVPSVDAAIQQLAQLLQQFLKMQMAAAAPAPAPTGVAPVQQQQGQWQPVGRRWNSRKQGKSLQCYQCSSSEHVVRDCPYPCAACNVRGHATARCPVLRQQKNATRDTHSPQ